MKKDGMSEEEKRERRELRARRRHRRVRRFISNLTAFVITLCVVGVVAAFLSKKIQTDTGMTLYSLTSMGFIAAEDELAAASLPGKAVISARTVLSAAKHISKEGLTLEDAGDGVEAFITTPLGLLDAPMEEVTSAQLREETAGAGGNEASSTQAGDNAAGNGVNAGAAQDTADTTATEAGDNAAANAENTGATQDATSGTAAGQTSGAASDAANATEQNSGAAQEPTPETAQETTNPVEQTDAPAEDANSLLSQREPLQTAEDSSLLSQQQEIPSSLANGAYNDSFAKQVLDMINEERSAAGLYPLSWNVAASNAAKVRTQELVTHFGHQRPDGRRGLTALYDAGARGYAFGENLAAGQASPESVVKSWMNSPHHRDNILNGKFTSVGIACLYVANSENGYYWVQLFVGE